MENIFVCMLVFPPMSTVSVRFLLFIDQIQKISRFCEIPEKGVLCDLLWSDPTDEDKK